MNRRPIFYSNKPDSKKLVDLSPRFTFKKHQSLIKNNHNNHNIPLGTSAQMKKRKPDIKSIRLQSPPSYIRPKAQLKKINEQKQLLSQEQIRNSALYKLLEQQIKQLARRQEQEIEKLKKIRQQKKKQAEIVKKQQFATKLQIWELKNQVFDIKELIQEEKNQSQRLLEEIRPMGESGGEGSRLEQGERGDQSERDQGNREGDREADDERNQNEDNQLTENPWSY